MEYFNEKELEKYPAMISFESTEKILDQMNYSICRIKLMDGTLGTGFFCKIPYASKDKFLPILATNNHIINKLVLENKNEPIMIYTKNSLKYKTFYLDNRIYYTNEEYDITFTEIKENSDDIHNFLELDDNIIENISENNNDINYNPHFYYIKSTIYIMQYPEGKLSVSYGILDKTSKSNTFDFAHLCSTKEGSSGSPILNITNNKVFGIHKQASTIHNYNMGSFLDIAIKEFIKQNIYIIKYSSQPTNENKIENVNNNKEVDISEAKVDLNINLEKPKIEEPKFIVSAPQANIHDNVKAPISRNQPMGKPSLNAIFNPNILIDINAPKVEVPKVGDIDSKKDKKTMSLKEFAEKFKILEDNKIVSLYLIGRQCGNEILELINNLQFNELKDLRLGNNLISNINILEKYQCQKLEQLWLDNNKIHDITVFEKVKFKNLKVLYLDHNNISDIKVFLNVNFENLEKLNLNNNQISDITILEKVKFPEIKNLSFFQNNISDIKFFERVKFNKLSSLDLRNNNINKNLFSSTINELKNKIKFVLI